MKWVVVCLFVLLSGCTMSSDTPKYLLAEGAPTVSGNYLQAVTVLVKAGTWYGTGVAFNVGPTSYVITCAHIIPVEEQKNIVVKKPIFDGQHVVSTRSANATIIAGYVKNEGDLVLLKVEEPNFFPFSARFHKGEMPVVGTQVFHVGSPHREDNFCAFTGGFVSLYRPKSIFEASCIAFPGCSGGGVFLADGRCIGLVVASYKETRTADVIGIELVHKLVREQGRGLVLP